MNITSENEYIFIIAEAATGVIPLKRCSQRFCKFHW